VSKNIFVFDNKYVRVRRVPIDISFLKFRPSFIQKNLQQFFDNKIFYICAHLQKRDVWFSFFVTYIEKIQKRDFASFELNATVKGCFWEGGSEKKNVYNRPPAKDSVAKTTLRGEWNSSWFPLVSKYIVSKIHPNRYICVDRLICFQDNIFQRSKQIIIQFQLK